MMPVAKAPIGAITVPAACAFVKQAVMVLGVGIALIAETIMVSVKSPSSVVRAMYEFGGPVTAHMPLTALNGAGAVVSTDTWMAFKDGVPASQVTTVAG